MPAQRQQSSSALTWALALLIPILAAGVAWLVSDATLSVPDCTPVTGGAGFTWIADIALLVAGPVTVGLRVRRSTRGRDMFPVVISILFSLVLATVEPWLWWANHNCPT